MSEVKLNPKISQPKTPKTTAVRGVSVEGTGRRRRGEGDDAGKGQHGKTVSGNQDHKGQFTTRQGSLENVPCWSRDRPKTRQRYISHYNQLPLTTYVMQENTQISIITS